MSKRRKRRRVTFVTGTRAEFGLMRTTLRAIADHPKLSLQTVATGMHLDRRHGDGRRSIRDAGFAIDATVPWPRSDSDATALAAATGAAMAGLARQFDRLDSDIVLVVGDRVEAFAAASAAHLGGRIVAHVHGGDRAAGQVDDCLRHAISKLAHLHFPAMTESRSRLIRLGEERDRIFCCGSPGIDGIVASAGDSGRAPRSFALIVQHPVSADEIAEQRTMRRILDASRRHCGEAVVIYPNNDPGAAGIIREIDRRNSKKWLTIARDLPRERFLGLLRDASVLIGNSSSGIIEAASFGTPVIDVGRRQHGRQRGRNVVYADESTLAIETALSSLRIGHGFRRFPRRNIYGGIDTGRRIAEVLATENIDDRLRKKLITY